MAPSPTVSHGRERTSRQPMRSRARKPSPSSGSAPRGANPGRIAIRHAALTANVSASSAMTSPGAPIARTTPASTGPAMFATLRVKPIKALASCSRSGATVCGMRPIRAGMKIAAQAPHTADSATSIQTSALPVSRRVASTAWQIVRMTSAAIIVRLGPTRSDSTPPAIAKSANGMPLAARTMPRSVASPISRTANAIATAIMRSPTTDSDCPAKRSRNGSRARIVEGMWTWTRPPMAGLTLPAGRRGGTFAGGPAVGRRSCAARRGRLSRHPLEHGGVDIEVAVDLADVVVVLEGVDQAHEAPGDLLVERHAGLRVLDDLGVLELDARGLERGAHRREVAGLGEHLEDVVVDRDVERAGLDRGQQVVLRVARAVDDDHAALVEEVRDGAGFPQIAAVLGEHVTHLGARAVAVVGQRLDEQRDAARPIALVEDGLERVGVRALAGALRDRALDVVLGHGGVLGLLDGERERRVAVDVAAALLRGDRDRARQLREQLAAAGVDDRLLVLDPRPFRGTGHAADGSGRAGIPRIAAMATVPEQIFKAYDVRGLYGDDIDEEIAEQLGRAFVRVLSDLAGKETSDLRVGLGRDMRLTAPELSERYKRGMVSEG